MTTWVLLRGLARESRHWGSFPSVLRSHVREGSRIVALDLPGNGAQWKRRSPASVELMVQAYREQLAAMCVRGPVVLLGLSLGAMVAAEWAYRHPQELAGCVLVNGSANGLTPAWQRLRPAAWAALLRALLLAGQPVGRERAILRLCSSAPDDALAALWAAYAMQSGTSPANVLRQLWAAARYRLPRRPPSLPVLVLSSGADRLVSPAGPAAMAASWGAPLIVHPGAGHELSLDAPHWLARQCAGFELSRVPACHRTDAWMP